MKKLGMIETICFVSLMITAICFAGCSTTSTSPIATGMSSMPLIGHDEGKIPFINPKGEVEEMVNVVVDINGDKNLVVEKTSRYMPLWGQGHIMALNSKGCIFFSFGIANKGNAPIKITGATINGRSFGYADESVYPQGTVTIGPGKTVKVQWSWPVEWNKEAKFSIEVQSSGGGETKAQTGTVKPTQTQQTSGSVPTTASVGPTPTQVLEDYLKAVEEGDFNNLPVAEKPSRGWDDDERAILSIQAQALKDGTFKITPIGPPVYKNSQEAYLPVTIIEPHGSRQGEIEFKFVEGHWLVQTLWRGG
jgi:hypothetical protein